MKESAAEKAGGLTCGSDACKRLPAQPPNLQRAKLLLGASNFLCKGMDQMSDSDSESDKVLLGGSGIPRALYQRARKQFSEDIIHEAAQLTPMQVQELSSRVGSA